ncbi:hypothetical protein LINGRAHAP2_LOCUS31532 [Linum grandiflorum]
MAHCSFRPHYLRNRSGSGSQHPQPPQNHRTVAAGGSSRIQLRIHPPRIGSVRSRLLR